MGFRYRPQLRFGNVRVGKTGVSIRTGIPGLTFRHDFKSKNGSASTDTDPFRPTVGYSVAVTLLFWLALVSVTWLLGNLVNAQWFFLAPFLFVWGVLKPLIRTITGKANGLPLLPNERTIEAVEGLVKLTILSLSIASGHTKYVADKNKYTFDMPALQMKGLTIGSSASQLRKVEQKKPYLSTDWSITYHKSKYANEIGEIEYRLDHNQINKIEFVKRNDTASYGRLLPLLLIKYGPARDSSAFGVTWKTDSTSLTINKIDSDVYVTLKADKYYRKKR